MRKVLSAIINWGKVTQRAFTGSHCSLHAAGLTYFSMLALMPILCCILVLAKVAHVDAFAKSQINGQIDAFITNVEKGNARADAETAPADPVQAERERKKRIAAEEFARQARAFSDQMFARIERFDVRKMGFVGFLLLLWSVISSLGHVEVSVNEIWGLTKPRPLWKKAYVYLFIAVVMPVLAALAMSMPILQVVKDVIVATMGATWLTKWASDGLVWFIDFWAFRLLISVSFTSLAFAYLLWVLPNGRVSFRCAWRGGVLTAILFLAVLKVCSVAQVGIAKSSALYGSFAFLPIVLAWFYMSWQVVLLGACASLGFERARSEIVKGKGEIKP